jgi:hypothetical protein
METFVRLGSTLVASHSTPAGLQDTPSIPIKTTSKKKRSVYTDAKNGQRVDLDSNHNATLYIGRKCEMTLFDPNNLPPTLLEGSRPLINRDNVTSPFEYEADLMIYEGCRRRSQTEDFQS